MKKFLTLFILTCFLTCPLQGQEDVDVVLLRENLSVVSGNPKILDPAQGSQYPGIETGEYDQAAVKLPNGLEVRLKEQSRCVFLSAGNVRVEKGLVGLRLLENTKPITISVFPGLFQMKPGIVVCKVYPGLFRLAVLKGEVSLRLSQGVSRRYIATEEVAGCVQEISQTFKALPDLYFAWYWNKERNN